MCTPVNIEIRFPWERMGTCNSAESLRKRGSFGYPQPPNRAATAALLGKKLDKIKRRGLKRKESIGFLSPKNCNFACSEPLCVWIDAFVCTHACLCICGSETFTSYVSVKGSEG